MMFQRADPKGMGGGSIDEIIHVNADIFYDIMSLCCFPSGLILAWTRMSDFFYVKGGEKYFLLMLFDSSKK